MLKSIITNNLVVVALCADHALVLADPIVLSAKEISLDSNKKIVKVNYVMK